MEARLRSWFRQLWQQIKQYRVTIGVVVVLVLILFIFLAYRFGWEWTGFNSGTNQITITSTSKVNYTATVPQPSKTIWDWLGLLAVLAIPAVVGIGAALYTEHQKKVRDLEKADIQRETRLQSYIDKISELLLKENLRTLTEVQQEARARTLMVLPKLYPDGKGIVLQFLSDRGLIVRGNPIIDLSTPVESYNPSAVADLILVANLSCANLRDAYLPNAKLNKINLHKAILRKATLFGTDLSETDLRGADLQGADLSGANLSGANLSEAILSKAIFAIRTGSISANLSGANLKQADLSGANLKDVTGITVEALEKQARSLKGAIMPDGKMYRNSSGADLVGAKLSGVDLSGVDLSGANLSGADLSNTDLSGANLIGAIGTTPEQLAKAKSLNGATMPDGSIHP